MVVILMTVIIIIMLESRVKLKAEILYLAYLDFSGSCFTFE